LRIRVKILTGPSQTAVIADRAAEAGRPCRGRAHVEDVLPEAADVPACGGAEAADQGGGDGAPVVVHHDERGGQISDVGQHHRIGDEARAFELFFLLNRIAAPNDRAAERDPIEEVVEGFDLGGLGADCPVDFRVGDEPQQEQRALDAADLAERPVQQAAVVVRAELAQQHRRWARWAVAAAALPCVLVIVQLARLRGPGVLPLCDGSSLYGFPWRTVRRPLLVGAVSAVLRQTSCEATRRNGLMRAGRLFLAVVITAIIGPFAHAQSLPPDAPVVQLGSLDPPAVASMDAPGADAAADDSATELAKKLQNPIGNLTVAPFQNNTNFNALPHGGTQNILNVQPVVPIHLNPEWNVIVRTILPLEWGSTYQRTQHVPFGVSPTTVAIALSPENPTHGWVWGVGPIVQLPTITNKALGSNIWGLGPSMVVLHTSGRIVAGLSVNNIFSQGGTSGPLGTAYSLLTINPFFNYNFGEGWFLGTAPIATASWLSGGEKWTLPVGGQFGRLIKIAGRLPVNLLTGVYYNALRPGSGATWEWRTQVTFVF